MRMLILYTHLSGALIPILTFPLNIRQKFTYFVRKEPEIITEENIAEMLMIGDMSHKPIEELAVLMQDVFVPLLMNPLNQSGWPIVVSEDVTTRVQNFSSILYQVIFVLICN